MFRYKIRIEYDGRGFVGWQRQDNGFSVQQALEEAVEKFCGEKATLFGLLDATEATGVALTESFAMTPAASVAGWYFSHPDAHYFGVGRIGKDQVADYADRRGMPVHEAERWLAPNLAYDPEDDR